MVVEREQGGAIRGLLYDIRALHRYWMSIAFPKVGEDAHAVMGRWRPESTGQRAGYYLWAAVGALALLVVYPLLLGGLATRFYTRRFDNARSRLGLIGVIVVTALLWGLLTLFARAQFSPQGFLAVAAASVVAVVSAILAVVFTEIDGRTTTVLLAYPAAMNAVFLPPVVAALYSPTLGAVVFPGSENIAIWILDNVLFVGGLNSRIRAAFDLEGIAYVLMWFGIAVPLGWFLGLMVTLADAVRPKEPEETTEREDSESLA